MTITEALARLYASIPLLVIALVLYALAFSYGIRFWCIWRGIPFRDPPAAVLPVFIASLALAAIYTAFTFWPDLDEEVRRGVSRLVLWTWVLTLINTNRGPVEGAAVYLRGLYRRRKQRGK